MSLSAGSLSLDRLPSQSFSVCDSISIWGRAESDPLCIWVWEGQVPSEHTGSQRDSCTLMSNRNLESASERAAFQVVEWPRVTLQE